MTCKERLSVEYPNMVTILAAGGCYGCPDTYGYLPSPSNCPGPDNVFAHCSECDVCWNREIRATESKVY